MVEKETPPVHELADNHSSDVDEPDWQARGDEHPLEGGQSSAVDALQEKNDAFAGGSSYRKEADGPGELTDDAITTGPWQRPTSELAEQ